MINRWSVITKAWEIAHASFPDKKIWVNVPYKLTTSGNMNIFDLDSKQQVGVVPYRAEARRGQVILTMMYAGRHVELEIPHINTRSFKVMASKLSDCKLGEIVSSQYDGDELIKKVCQIIEAEDIDKEIIKQWLINNNFPDISKKVLAHFNQDTLVKTAKGPAAPKPRYEKYQKVRIVNPKSMEHMELGTIKDIKGTKKDGFYYMVLVDGSSEESVFHESLLQPNFAGVAIV